MRWHVLAAISCGLAITTKIAWPVGLIYIIAAYAGYEGSITTRVRQVFSGRNFWTFALVLTAVTALTGPALWRLSELDPQNLALDSYFHPDPSAWRAVDLWSAFPNGRYSSGLVLNLILAIGPVTYALGIVGLALRRVPGRDLAMWGVFTLASLFPILIMTLARSPMLFTLCTPLFALACGALFNGWCARGKRPVATAARFCAVGFVLAFAVYQFNAVTAAVAGAVSARGEALEILGPDHKRTMENTALLVSNGLTSGQGLDAKRLKTQIFERDFRYILALDSYFINFSHNKNRPEYVRQYVFFEKMLNGCSPYKVLWKKTIDFPLKFLFWGDQALYTFYLFEKRGHVQDTP